MHRARALARLRPKTPNTTHSPPHRDSLDTPKTPSRSARYAFRDRPRRVALLVAPSAVPGRGWRLRSATSLQLRFQISPAWPLPAARQIEGDVLPRRSGDECGDDVRRMPVEAGTCPVVAHGGARIGVEAASCTSRSGTPASRAAVINACRSVWGLTCLLIPARLVTRRTTRAAPCRSSRRRPR